MIVNTRDEALVQLGILAGKARWISAKTKVRDGYEEYFNPNCEINERACLLLSWMSTKFGIRDSICLK